MAEKPFDFTLITPDKKVFEGSVVSLVVPCALGYAGFLANHAPFVANVIPGKILIRKDTRETVALQSKGKGFLEVIENRAVLLLDRLE